MGSKRGKKKKFIPSARMVLIGNRAKKLRKRNIPAEQWFQKKWQSDGMMVAGVSFKGFKDRFNVAFQHTYIPDVWNIYWRYIIEIDEPHHLVPEQKSRDMDRDRFFIDRGYKVFRIPAYDDDSYHRVRVEIAAIRESNPLPQDMPKYRKSVVKRAGGRGRYLSGFVSRHTNT